MIIKTNNLKREHFAVGQKVGVINDGERREVLTGIVTSIGRKYLTVEINSYLTIKFNMENFFHEETKYSPTYWLFRTEEEAQAAFERSKMSWEIRRFHKWESLPKEELKKIYEIISKSYDMEENQ